MADNLPITPGSGAVVATDQIGGNHHQLVKIEYGDDGSATEVSATNPLPVTVNSIPAASRTTDSTSTALASDAIMVGLTALTPKFAKISTSASGVTTVVALVAAKKIRVLAWSIVVNAAVNVKWQSHTAPTDITGLHYFAANGGINVPFSPVGHFETVAGEALDINLSGAVAVGGSLVYVEV